MAGKQRLLTGLQPSGQLHIGNYFGALKPFLLRYQEFESFLLIVDLHALTTQRNPDALREDILNIAADYLAVGVDPKKVIMFRQSAVPEHAELAWIFECLVTVPFLMQAHAYKDKVAKGLEANAGLFNYPMLMAADILLYDTKFVPVGEDQRQHVEYAREAATKFNTAYGKTFEPPQEIIFEDVGTVPGTDGGKMSKSYKNTIPLFGSREEIQRAVMSIVTDSEGEYPEHVWAIHKLYKTEAELTSLYEEKRGKYKDLKEALAEDIDAYIRPMREKRKQLLANKEEISRVLLDGAQRAQIQARVKMADVRNRVGLTL